MKYNRENFEDVYDVTKSVTAMVVELGVSRPTYYRHLERYEEENVLIAVHVEALKAELEEVKRTDTPRLKGRKLEDAVAKIYSSNTPRVDSRFVIETTALGGLISLEVVDVADVLGLDLAEVESHYKDLD